MILAFHRAGHHWRRLGRRVWSSHWKFVILKIPSNGIFKITGNFSKKLTAELVMHPCATLTTGRLDEFVEILFPVID